MKSTPVRLLAFAASLLVILPSAEGAETKALIKPAATASPTVLSLGQASLGPQDLEKLPAGQVLESGGEKMTAGELRARRIKVAENHENLKAQLSRSGLARFQQTRQQFLASQMSKLATESQQAFQSFRSSHPGGVTQN
jgi:hypothetical protein